MKKIYVGPKEKNIKYTNYFDSSITLIGSNIGNNKSLSNDIPFDFWNDDNLDKEVDFYNKELNKLTEEVEIMAHNPFVLNKCNLPDNCKFICKNSDELLYLLNNKIRTRDYLKDIVPILKYKIINGSSFNYQKLKKEFGNNIVVQSPYGSGGAKTFFCNENNHEKIKNLLLFNDKYSISKYEENNLSITIYAIIGDYEIEILPFSQQKFEIEDNIEWVDSVYDIIFNKNLSNKIFYNMKKICYKLKNDKYRGIINVDFLIVDDIVYLMEINARFGGTCWYIDKLLQENNLPSIYYYNNLAFNHSHLPSVKVIMDKLYNNF